MAIKIRLLLVVVILNFYIWYQFLSFCCLELACANNLPIGSFVNFYVKVDIHFDKLLQVYFAGLGCLKNVRAALCRGRALKCTRCGRRGATIGCRVDRCPKTYHLVGFILFLSK